MYCAFFWLPWQHSVRVRGKGSSFFSSVVAIVRFVSIEAINREINSFYGSCLLKSTLCKTEDNSMGDIKTHCHPVVAIESTTNLKTHNTKLHNHRMRYLWMSPMNWQKKFTGTNSNGQKSDTQSWIKNQHSSNRFFSYYSTQKRMINKKTNL